MFMHLCLCVSGSVYMCRWTPVEARKRCWFHWSWISHRLPWWPNVGAGTRPQILWENSMLSSVLCCLQPRLSQLSSPFLCLSLP